jgi:hypothetical protein
MRNRDYDSAVADVLAGLAGEATAVGESSVSRLVQALHTFARKLDKTRDEMQADLTGLQCSDCGRHWTAPFTVARERAWGLPSNCPACFNAKKAAQGSDDRSGLTATFSYVETPNDEA